MPATINASSSSGIVTTADNSAQLELQTASTTRLTINSSGNVGIGTTSPQRTLDISSTAQVISVFRSSNVGGSRLRLLDLNNVETDGLELLTNTTTSTIVAGSAVTLKPLTFITGGFERMRIDSSGNVGIGTASPTSGYRLDVAGNFKVSGSIDENVYAVVDAAGVALTPQNGTIQTWTLGASRTPTSGTWEAGESMTLMINDGTAFTVTWTTLGVVWVGGTAPTLATTGFTVIELWKVSTTIYGAVVGNVA